MANEIYVTIKVEGKDIAAQKKVIDQLDAILFNHFDATNAGVDIEFKNVRTRERKPKNIEQADPTPETTTAQVNQ